MAHLLDRPFNKQFTSNVPHLNLETVHTESDGPYPSVKKSYNPIVNPLSSSKSFSVRNNNWEARRINLANKVQGHLDEIEGILKPQKSGPSLKDGLNNNSRDYQNQEINQFGKRAQTRDQNPFFKDDAGYDIMGNPRGFKQLDLSQRKPGSKIDRRSDDSKYRVLPEIGVSEREFNRGGLGNRYFTPQAIKNAKIGGLWSNSIEKEHQLPRVEDIFREETARIKEKMERLYPSRKLDEELSDIRIYPHTSANTQRSIADIRKPQTGNEGRYSYNPKGLRTEDADNRPRSNSSSEAPMGVLRYLNWRLTKDVEHEKKAKMIQFKDEIKVYNKGNTGFSEERLNLRHQADIAKKEEQRQLLMKAYAQQMEITKANKESEKERQKLEDLKEEERLAKERRDLQKKHQGDGLERSEERERTPLASNSGQKRGKNRKSPSPDQDMDMGERGIYHSGNAGPSIFKQNRGVRRGLFTEMGSGLKPDEPMINSLFVVNGKLGDLKAGLQSQSHMIKKINNIHETKMESLSLSGRNNHMQKDLIELSGIIKQQLRDVETESMTESINPNLSSSWLLNRKSPTTGSIKQSIFIKKSESDAVLRPYFFDKTVSMRISKGKASDLKELQPQVFKNNSKVSVSKVYSSRLDNPDSVVITGELEGETHKIVHKDSGLRVGSLEHLPTRESPELAGEEKFFGVPSQKIGTYHQAKSDSLDISNDFWYDKIVSNLREIREITAIQKEGKDLQSSEVGRKYKFYVSKKDTHQDEDDDRKDDANILKKLNSIENIMKADEEYDGERSTFA